MKYPTAKIKRKCVDEDLIEIDPAKLIDFYSKDFRVYLVGSTKTLMETRNGGDFNDRAIYLSDEYNWVIARDSVGELCLIPTRKE